MGQTGLSEIVFLRFCLAGQKINSIRFGVFDNIFELECLTISPQRSLSPLLSAPTHAHPTQACTHMYT